MVRCLTSSTANAFAIAAARLGLPAVATMEMMLLWLSGLTLIEPSSALRPMWKPYPVLTPSAISGVWIRRAAVRTPLVRPLDSLITGTPTNVASPSLTGLTSTCASASYFFAAVSETIAALPTLMTTRVRISSQCSRSAVR